jgi:hypothetical protein
MRSGSVNAFQTSSRGASNTRAMVNSAVSVPGRERPALAALLALIRFP